MTKNRAHVQVVSGDALDVRWFDVREEMSQLFDITVRAVSSELDIDFDAIIGQEAAFSLESPRKVRSWRGIVIDAGQIRVDREGLATYELRIAPRAHLLTLRKNYRIFQYKSELDIVTDLLGEWGVPFRVLADASVRKQRKYRTQYGESDFTFLSRMLEDAGISFYFDAEDGASTLVLDEEPQSRAVAYAGLRFYDSPDVEGIDFVTKVTVAARVRPAKMTIGDLDYRRGSEQQPRLSAALGLGQEAALEQFDYEPGAFLYEAKAGGSTPTADDRGTARTDESAGAQKTHNRLLGLRNDAKRVGFESNVIELGPGMLVEIPNHPHADVAPGLGLLVVRSRITGQHEEQWRVHAETAAADQPYRPARMTPRPRVPGLESATVVGQSAEEIHADEYARVRVHFHWDREGDRDEKSSCWIPTNQPWAGAGFGGTVLPRIGQEVLVEFLNGDPDRPVVIGRMFTELQPPPYPLPAGKKISGLVGKSSPALVVGGSMTMADNNVYMAEITGKPEYKARHPQEFPISNRDNAFLLGDEQGSNLTFLQARRDLHLLVKHGWRSVIGNYRANMIIGDDQLYVRNKQFINVISDQILSISKDQDINVAKKREETVTGDVGLFVRKDAMISSKGVVNHKSKGAIMIEAGERIAIFVGASLIVIDKENIVVDSLRVDVNP